MGIREQVTQLFGTRGKRDQDQRNADREQNRARTPEEATGQRESRRVSGMSAEDRAWEAASLERNRAAQDGPTT